MALIFNMSVCVRGCCCCVQGHDVKKAHAMLHITMRGVARGNRPTILTYRDIALNRELTRVTGLGSRLVCVCVYMCVCLRSHTICL